MNKRIVVTGLGVVSSIGIGKDDFWQAAIAGKSGISPITSFDTADFPTHLGGEVKNFNAEKFISKEKIKHYGRTSQLAIAAAKLALEDAKINSGSCSGLAGVCVGTTMAESQILEKLNYARVTQGVGAVDAGLVCSYPANTLSVNMVKELELDGPHYVIPTACAAGNYAIGYACDLLKKGLARMMLAGGADAFSRLAFIGFNRLLAIAPIKCQPFDKNRKGMMVGEGAGMIVLEILEDALKRKADIYAEVLGYGLSCDAHHMTAPYAPGIARAIEKALKESGIAPGEVDYINTHGTGTPANDREECLAIKKVFGEHANKLLVSSTKSMLGHTMGAASAIEAIVCCLSVKNDIISPTINHETPDPDCDLDCVPNTCRKTKIHIALNNASAFGGNNACLALKKYAA
jgi:3-oxoacyl-[acyl-carrier-protein] synthase II